MIPRNEVSQHTDSRVPPSNKDGSRQPFCLAVPLIYLVWSFLELTVRRSSEEKKIDGYQEDHDKDQNADHS